MKFPKYTDMYAQGESDTQYRKVTSDYVSTITVDGQEILKVEPEGLRLLTVEAMRDISHLLRTSHYEKLAKILDDPEASDNDRFVARELFKNANIAAGMVLPSCQDTGTGIVMGKKGQFVWTDGDDNEIINQGVIDTFTQNNLRYSQLAPKSLFEETNTKTNGPAQVDIYATEGKEYHFLFIAKGGGSANKTFLYQQNPAILREDKLSEFLDEKIRTLGTSACPPYHLAVVIGGLSAEQNLKTVKMASTHYLDDLPTEGSDFGQAIRCPEMEEKILKMTQAFDIGAQFGGKYFCHDVRVIRMPRHGASVPIGIGVSCSADRQAKGKITKDGIFIEQLERDPARFMPDVKKDILSSSVIKINLNCPMDEVLAELSKHPVRTRLSLTGTIVVARDLAHATILKKLEDGEPMPNYLKDYIVYYAGPAKTPKGYASGSFGPTTAGRMDSYVETFQKAGGSMVMLAKGNRSNQVTDSCKKFGGFYLGSIGGPAAILATNNITKVEVLDFEDFGMEAVWKIDVKDFPAFIIVDDKGNDFFKIKLN
ncbi:MAG: fumarate hydratase [Kordiimonadaceae bacterium]|jgi:fumarate hydratase class I|nr:fumarate hydratase [Kordiimonadaceae bacterium]MBT7604111.1 fumarate hydratase [Kordiimonadaceae bacterium]MDC0081313.1 fumarate hydratase [Emcibacteraceae bacterium]MDC1429399.1 fumarate hydratase [Emcibacteraceae bacterium]|tara:strand:- start:28527 stop:30143 length:1617 start_codon:yes stop_codon:yes gene_type:complete